MLGIGNLLEELFSCDADGQDPTCRWGEEGGAQLHTPGSLLWPWHSQGCVLSTSEAVQRGGRQHSLAMFNVLFPPLRLPFSSPG